MTLNTRTVQTVLELNLRCLSTLLLLNVLHSVLAVLSDTAHKQSKQDAVGDMLQIEDFIY